MHDPRPQPPQPPVGGHAPSVPPSRADLAGLRHVLTRQQHRRQHYRAGPLRVAWDGEEPWPVGFQDGVCAPFRVPPTAAVLEVFGDDAEGALLLAIVPLPDSDVLEADGVEQLSVTLEGGQMVVVTLALDEGTDEEDGAYVIHPAYHDEGCRQLDDRLAP
jgi:hypothetical protein